MTFQPEAVRVTGTTVVRRINKEQKKKTGVILLEKGSEERKQFATFNHQRQKCGSTLKCDCACVCLHVFERF